MSEQVAAHTTDNILQTGSELDALIAEKVMGWSDVRQGHYRGSPDLWYGRPPEIPRWESPQNKEKGISTLPRYSRDIDAAWDVRAFMRKEGYRLRLEEYDDDTWDAWFHIFDNRVKGYGHATTAPLAICLAALKARE